MKSSYFLTDNILTISLNPADITLQNIAIEFLQLIKANSVNDVILDLALFETITTTDIKFIEKVVDIFKLNNIYVIVCNINVYSASILFHFIDDISFPTTLDIQSAIDVIKSR